jgi:hypothetical protein
MGNELIWLDNRHGVCVRACQTGWKGGYGNKGFVSKLVFYFLKVEGVVACELK